MNTKIRLRPATLVASAVAIVLAQGAIAQETATLGEITVTARKRAESLEDVPFAVSARTGAQLEAAGAKNIEDISRNVAGLTVENLGPGQSQVALRGISAGKQDRDLPGVKEQVGVYMDESVISLSLFTPDLDLYDLNRVEVLRGPQGTLFGSGSLSGTVRYISNQPDLTDNYGSVELGYSMVDNGGDGYDAHAMMNFAFSDKLAMRIVGYSNELPGFIDAIQPGGAVKKDVNSGTKDGARLAFRFEPTENIAITPRIIYQDTNVDGFNREDVWNILANPYTTTETPVTIGPRQQYTQLREHFADQFMLGDLTMEFDLGPAVLTSISSYTDRTILVVRDASQLTGSVTFDIGGGAASSAQVRTSSPLRDGTQVQVFTQELRLSSDTDSRFQWVVGGFYSDIDRDYGQALPTPGYDDIMIDLICGGPPNCGVTSHDLGSPPDTPFYSRIPYKFKQTAFFAEGSWDLTERLNATLGARYYDFSEDRVLYFGGLFADSDGLPTEPTNGPGSTNDDGILPRLLLSYDLADNVKLNAQASEGFRLGGINDPLNVPLCSPEDLATFTGFDSFGSETLWNYELGAKIGFAGGRGQFNVSAFYADISDLQLPVLAGTCSSRILLNVPQAHSTGVEFELTAQPTDHFDFGISASYTESELDSTVTVPVNGVPTVIANIVEGNRLPAVPDFQLSANATYSWPMTDRLEGYVTGVYQHIGSRYTQNADEAPGFGTFDIRSFGDPTVSSFTFDPLLPAYDIGNIRFGIRSGDWEAAFYVNNVSDENAKLALDQERGRVARVGFLTNQPRTYGLMFHKDFGRSAR
jgi:iron complex outermembrane recepter protein